MLYRPNRNLGVPLTRLVKSGSTVQYLNLAAVSPPAATTSTGALVSPFGNFSRNPALGPSFFGTDLALSKTFGATADGLRVQFRAEAYNLFNHTNFTPASGGTIGSTYPARILQFGLKVNY